MDQLNNLQGNIEMKITSEKLTRISLNCKLVLLSGSTLPKVNEIIIDNNSKLSIMSNVNLENLRYLQVSSGSECIINENVNVQNITNICNEGRIECRECILELLSIINGYNAEFSIFRKLSIKGRYVTEEDMIKGKGLKDVYQNQIGLYNDGIINIKTPPEECIDILSNYYGTKNSSINIYSGNISVMKEFKNEGIFRSTQHIHILVGKTFEIKYSENKQTESVPYNGRFEGVISTLGKFVADKGIYFFISGNQIIYINNTFEPKIIDKNGYLSIASSQDIVKFNSDLCWNNINLYLNILNYEGKYNVSLKKFKLETRKFYNEKSISTQDETIMKTTSFDNNSGRIQSGGNIIVEVDGSFKNGGGGTIEKNVSETIEYNTFNNETKVIKNEKREIHKDIYISELEKCGIIISIHKDITIKSCTFDNTFGIIIGKGQIKIQGEFIRNIYGLIYGEREVEIVSRMIYNNYVKERQEFQTVDLEKPIHEDQIIETKEWIKSGYYQWKGRIGHVIGQKEWVDTSHYEIHTKTETIFKGYEMKTIYFEGVEYPGYIFSMGNINLNIEELNYPGIIVCSDNSTNSSSGSSNNISNNIFSEHISKKPPSEIKTN